MLNQSLSEAYETLHLHLSRPTGLMNQIEQGLPIDETKVKEIEDAIAIIVREWRKVSVVPKHVVQLFCNLFPRLEKCLHLHPSQEPEIRKLYYKFGAWIDDLFAEEPLSEEAAIAIVHQQIGGLPPLALELRSGSKLTEGSLDLFYGALERLAEVWQPKASLSKLAAGAMINAQEIFISLADNYTGTERQRVKEIEHQVTSRIVRCFT